LTSTLAPVRTVLSTQAINRAECLSATLTRQKCRRAIHASAVDGTKLLLGLPFKRKSASAALLFRDAVTAFAATHRATLASSKKLGDALLDATPNTDFARDLPTWSGNARIGIHFHKTQPADRCF